MKLKDIEKFIDLAKEKGVSKLSYEEDDKKLSVSFESSAPVNTFIAPSAPSYGDRESSSAASRTSNQAGHKEIKSPFVGTFYRSSSPDTDPYVKVGDSVSEGKVLCIIEAMKIMNEIEAELSGEIVEICVEDETYVEFGQTLFKLK